MSKDYAASALKAEDTGNRKLADYCARQALKYGDKALRIAPKATKIRPEDIASVQRLVDGFKGKKESEDVFRDFRNLASRIGIAAEKPLDAIAGRLVGMYRIASSRLDMDPDALKLIYDNDMVPRNLRDTIMNYAAGHLSKEDAAKKVEELKERTEKYLRQGGFDPSNPQEIGFSFFRSGGLEKNLDDRKR